MGSISTMEEICSESSKPHTFWLFSVRHNNSKSYWVDKDCLVDTEEGTSDDVFDIMLLSHFIFSLSSSSSSSSSFEVNGTLKASGNEKFVFYEKYLENYVDSSF